MEDNKHMPARQVLSLAMLVLGGCPLVAIPIGFGLWLGVGASFISFGIISLVYAIATAIIYSSASEYFE